MYQKCFHILLPQPNQVSFNKHMIETTQRHQQLYSLKLTLEWILYCGKFKRIDMCKVKICLFELGKPPTLNVSSSYLCSPPHPSIPQWLSSQLISHFLAPQIILLYRKWHGSVFHLNVAHFRITQFSLSFCLFKQQERREEIKLGGEGENNEPGQC